MSRPDHRTDASTDALRGSQGHPRRSYATNWQEGERHQRTRWRTKPPADVAPIVRETGADHVAMVGQSPMIRPPVGHEEPARSSERPPTPTLRDLGREPDLPVKRSEHLRNVDQLSLQLDDQQRCCACVPREPIDHATFAVDGERDLRNERPATEPVDPLRDSLVERCVPRIDRAIELAATPPDPEIDPGVEGKGDLMDGGHRHALGQPAFDPGDGSCRRPRSHCKLDLRPAISNAQSS